MKNEDKAKSLFFHFCNEKSCKGYDECVNCPNAKVHEGLIQMAEWKDEQFKRQKQKLKEFENWLYNKQSDFKYEGMREELVGLNAAIQKFEELGLN